MKVSCDDKTEPVLSEESFITSSLSLKLLSSDLDLRISTSIIGLFLSASRSSSIFLRTKICTSTRTGCLFLITVRKFPPPSLAKYEFALVGCKADFSFYFTFTSEGTRTRNYTTCCQFLEDYPVRHLQSLNLKSSHNVHSVPVNVS